MLRSLLVRITPFRISKGVIALSSPYLSMVPVFMIAMLTIRSTILNKIGHHVKKGKFCACEQKDATVLPDRTAAT